MSYSMEPMQLRYALEIVKWEYPKPYHVYNMEGSPLAIAELLMASILVPSKTTS